MSLLTLATQASLPSFLLVPLTSHRNDICGERNAGTLCGQPFAPPIAAGFKRLNPTGHGFRMSWMSLYPICGGQTRGRWRERAAARPRVATVRGLDGVIQRAIVLGT